MSLNTNGSNANVAYSLIEAQRAELETLRLEVMRQGSRFNCMVLDKPPMPVRDFYRNKAEFLKACGDAADAFMAASALQGSRREVA